MQVNMNGLTLWEMLLLQDEHLTIDLSMAVTLWLFSMQIGVSWGRGLMKNWLMSAGILCYGTNPTPNIIDATILMEHALHPVLVVRWSEVNIFTYLRVGPLMV